VLSRTVLSLHALGESVQQRRPAKMVVVIVMVMVMVIEMMVVMEMVMVMGRGPVRDQM
jgi:hypothetical protein